MTDKEALIYGKKILLILILIISFVTGIAGANKKFTLVIDPGHGGRDSGAPGAFSVEKNINLNVALAFGRYVEQNCPDVRVVYTRKTDVFIPLYERANIANNCKADLFISVHTNALKGVHTARGFETYTLGDGRSHAKETNLEVAKRENSVIFLEKDYKQHYVGFDPNSPESNIVFELIQEKNLSKSIDFAKCCKSTFAVVQIVRIKAYISRTLPCCDSPLCQHVSLSWDTSLHPTRNVSSITNRASTSWGVQYTTPLPNTKQIRQRHHRAIQDDVATAERDFYREHREA